jgi:hypothetical protein
MESGKAPPVVALTEPAHTDLELAPAVVQVARPVVDFEQAAGYATAMSRNSSQGFPKSARPI